MPGIGISENTANDIANLIRESSEEAIRWMFKIGAQSEWYEFLAVVAGLWLLSIIGSLFDFLTLLFIGMYYYVSLYVASVYMLYNM